MESTSDNQGGMRRLHLRGRENILKRLVVHSSAANLGLLMRELFGKGTPRLGRNTTCHHFVLPAVLSVPGLCQRRL
jgi:hypothetical protein